MAKVTVIEIGIPGIPGPRGLPGPSGGADVIDARTYGVVADGVTDDSADLSAAMDDALAQDKPLLLPSGRLYLNTVFIKTFEGTLHILGTGTTELFLQGASGQTITFNATLKATTTLAAPVAWGDQYITVTSTTGMAAGQLLYLSTTTGVDDSYGYDKQVVGVIARIDGANIYLIEPINFDFTIVETTVRAYGKASLIMSGISLINAVANRKIQLGKLQDCIIEKMTITGTGALTNDDPLVLDATYGVTIRDVVCQDSRYTINITTGSRNTLIDGLVARRVRHPVDANTWAYGTRIKNAIGYDCVNMIQCHPSFETHFENCIDRPLGSPGFPSGGIQLRCIGGSVKRCKVHSLDGVPTEDVQRSILLAPYQYIGQLYDRHYEDIESTTAILSAGDVRNVTFKRCRVPHIFIDGASYDVASVEIDKDTVITGTDRRRVIRCNLISPHEGLFVTPTSEWGFRGTVKDITGITQANPAVVTAVAHGFSNGDLVRIDGVVGMMQVNEIVHTIANVTTDTFELSGVNSTGYTAYSSGGKAAKGILMQTCDPALVPGIGWYPSLHYRSVIREEANTLSSATSVTIPVKLKHNWGINERTRRTIEITLRAFSSTDGAVIAKYQATVFQASTSAGALGAAQAQAGAVSTLTAVINNFAHHFYTQVAAEGGDPSNDIAQYYVSFDVVVTCNATTDKVQYVEIEVEERRAVT